MSTTSLHPILIKAALSARAPLAEVDAAAAYLAEVMGRIHGGTWRIDICHETCFVVVAKDCGEGPVKPKPEVA